MESVVGFPSEASFPRPASRRANSLVLINFAARQHCPCDPCQFVGDGDDDLSQKEQCTRGKYRVVQIHTCEAARQRAYALAKTSTFAIAQRARRKVEALFAELKNQIGLRRLRLRRMRFVREQFYLAAAAQNIKRLVRFLSKASVPTPTTA